LDNVFENFAHLFQIGRLAAMKRWAACALLRMAVSAGLAQRQRGCELTHGGDTGHVCEFLAVVLEF